MIENKDIVYLLNIVTWHHDLLWHLRAKAIKCLAKNISFTDSAMHR